MKLKRCALSLLALLLVFVSACSALSPSQPTGLTDNTGEADSGVSSNTDKETAPEADPQSDIEYGKAYYDLENVVLYLDAFGELPPNYITKSRARDLGWEGGPVEAFFTGGAIGGDSFGNREGLLPEAEGRYYTECDIDTLGASSRGAKRLVFSNDGLYFYTDDHYESFTQVYIDGGEVVYAP